MAEAGEKSSLLTRSELFAVFPVLLAHIFYPEHALWTSRASQVMYFAEIN